LARTQDNIDLLNKVISLSVKLKNSSGEKRERIRVELARLDGEVSDSELRLRIGYALHGYCSYWRDIALWHLHMARGIFTFNPNSFKRAGQIRERFERYLD